jgi:hypothetical protein
MTAAKPTPEHGFVALRETFNNGMGAAFPRGLDDSRDLVHPIYLAEAHVLLCVED